MSLNEKFGRSRGNVRKVKLQELPDLQLLQRLLSDLSTSTLGAECDVAWQSEGNFYTLNLVHSRQAVRASWKLYRGQGVQPKLVWEHATNDITVVHKAIQSDLAQINSAAAKEGAPRTWTEDRRAINLNNNLSSKLRHLFIGAQDDFAASAASERPPALSAPVDSSQLIEYADLSAGRDILKQLVVSDHGVFSYPTFLFFLEREYYEALENNTPITLVVFSTKNGADMGSVAAASSILEPVFLEVAKRLRQTQRKTDILARYEQDKFAVLLPDTNRAGGKAFVRRVEKALLKTGVSIVAKDGSLSCSFGIATLAEHCPTLPALLAFADKALQLAQQLGSNVITDEDILNDQRVSGFEYLSKSIDLAPTQQLVSQLVSAGIFTYPAFLSFLEHEYYRSARKKRELFVFLLKLRVNEETFDQSTNLLPPPAFYEVIRRVGTLLTKRDIFAHYGQGNFVILRSNTSAGQMENFSRRATQAILSEEWLTPECSAASLRIARQICTVRPHPTSPDLLGLVPVIY
jgi:GGDEF domain-containing protein